MVPQLERQPRIARLELLSQRKGIRQCFRTGIPRVCAAWKNWVLPRFNRDTDAPGVLAGWAPRNLKIGEFLGWRQDWGARSPCPFGGGRRAMADRRKCPRAAELRMA